MYDEFEMSMMGKLNFFLGLQIKQVEDKVFFNQSKYVKEMLKKFWLEDSKPTKTPMSSKIKLTKDDEADSVDSSKYRGDYVDRKSTSGVCTFMRCCLTSWFTKKQMAIIISTTEAEYVSARKACQKALWMKQALIDYGIRLDDVPIMIDYVGIPSGNSRQVARFTQNLDYATMMKQNKNLMDINIDALYNILKQNQGDVNDAMGSKKKTVVVTSDPLALIAEKTNVSRSKEKVLYLWTLKEVKPMILMS
uniref:Copia protein n=1 Tax=Tanacetum cinerariifolium TaxID=118510 RepID=A0A6L2NFJ2_TANCI|nr:copia protein [Tanacetum cinerariifolium]